MILSHRFTQALVYATELHAEQIRKGSKVPYISHLLGVASIALEYGADEDEAIAALLHDAIEDQGGQTVRAEIRVRFGERVTEIVDGCTETDTTPKPPWAERKKAYIARISSTLPSVRLVSAADKLHNIRSILKDYRTQGDVVWDLFKGGKQGTLWYYRSLVAAFHEADSTPIVIELDRLVTELERLVETDRAAVSF
ncbi:MAG: HD domain-containing protein [Trichodesmium sp. St17_bin3_1_1]|nr:HD domain-containing protein [Trichodesmium sp. St18_bin1]MDE5106082.1 HD domain-containing protein [Trichodesmium sp. St17_bin3_1_1]MDE5119989.1 HD domain-containing protein [Trichodesmium sp. St19_bin1]